MVTPQENRFARLALEDGALSAEELSRLLMVRTRKEQQGSPARLWEVAVTEGLVDTAVAEELAEAAGDLKVEKLGDFRILKKIGQGGMGSVYLGVDSDRQRAAIKVLGTELAKDRSLRTRFLREAQASCKLQHENIVQGLDVGEEASHLYFAMEYIDGTNIHDMMDKRGKLPAREATNLVLQIAEGLAYAHEKGFVHRDIKPGNMLVTKEGIAKLADLGLVRSVDSQRTALTRTGASLGTPWYMAPEQASDAKRADERSDIYALGASWYHMIAGRPPFVSDNVLEVLQMHLKEPPKPVHYWAPETPRNISQVIDRALAKDPDSRYQTAAELCSAIRKKCLATRDIRKELDVDAGEAQAQADEAKRWDAYVKVGGHREKRRMSTAEMRTRIEKGQINFETPVRPIGSDTEYRPAGSYLNLQRELPTNTPVPGSGGSSQQPATRLKLHDLITHYDEADKAYHRRKRLQQILPYVVEFAAIAALGLLVYVFRHPILDFVRGLAGG